MEHIANKVEKQELEINYIKKSLDELVEQNKNQNKQLEKISNSIQKQELILEKIGNLEEKYSDGLKRCHNRIDEELSRCKEEKAKYEDEIKLIKNDLMSKPCNTHNVIDKEIEFIKMEISKHNKIIWWGATLIIGVVIVAILKSQLK